MMLLDALTVVCALGFAVLDLVTTATFVDGLLADTFDEVGLLLVLVVCANNCGLADCVRVTLMLLWFYLLRQLFC